MKIFGTIVIAAVLVIGGRFIFTSLQANNTKIELEELASDTLTLSCAVFDGNEVWEDATVVIKDGVISGETSFKKGETESEYFLMPGMIDAHAHLTTPHQMEQLVKSGVTTVCDVSASEELEDSYDALNVWSSRSMIWMSVENPSAYVRSVVAHGGKYIKVVADQPKIMGGGTMDKALFEEIVRCAHENNLKVAVHATSIEGVRMVVDAGTDLLIHIPIGETFPEDLAREIAQKEIPVMPTLAMMQAFAESPLYGYKKADYEDAKEAVALLHSLDVPILVATDSSDSFFVPQLKHGDTLHKEMQLLTEAGLTPLEVLQGATTKAADAYGINDVGKIRPGEKATMVLIKGRPDQEITDSTKIVQIWVNGKPVLENKGGN